MKVEWRLPDRSVIETVQADAEQLLFLLRLVRNVRLNGHLYGLERSELVVEGGELSLAIQLK